MSAFTTPRRSPPPSYRSRPQSPRGNYIPTNARILDTSVESQPLQDVVVRVVAASDGSALIPGQGEERASVSPFELEHLASPQHQAESPSHIHQVSPTLGSRRDGDLGSLYRFFSPSNPRSRARIARLEELRGDADAEWLLASIARIGRPQSPPGTPEVVPFTDVSPVLVAPEIIPAGGTHGIPTPRRRRYEPPKPTRQPSRFTGPPSAPVPRALAVLAPVTAAPAASRLREVISAPEQIHVSVPTPAALPRVPMPAPSRPPPVSITPTPAPGSIAALDSVNRHHSAMPSLPQPATPPVPPRPNVAPVLDTYQRMIPTLGMIQDRRYLMRGGDGGYGLAIPRGVPPPPGLPLPPPPGLLQSLSYARIQAQQSSPSPRPLLRVNTQLGKFKNRAERQVQALPHLQAQYPVRSPPLPQSEFSAQPLPHIRAQPDSQSHAQVDQRCPEYQSPSHSVPPGARNPYHLQTSLLRGQPAQSRLGVQQPISIPSLYTGVHAAAPPPPPPPLARSTPLVAAPGARHSDSRPPTPPAKDPATLGLRARSMVNAKPAKLGPHDYRTVETIHERRDLRRVKTQARQDARVNGQYTPGWQTADVLLSQSAPNASTPMGGQIGQGGHVQVHTQPAQVHTQPAPVHPRPAQPQPQVIVRDFGQPLPSIHHSPVHDAEVYLARAQVQAHAALRARSQAPQGHAVRPPPHVRYPQPDAQPPLRSQLDHRSMLGVHTITTAMPPAPAPAPAHQVPSAPIAPVTSSQASSAPPAPHPVYVDLRQTASADPRESTGSSVHQYPSRRVGPVSALKGMFASHVVSNGLQRSRAKIQSHKPIEVEIVPTPTVTRPNPTRGTEATLAMDIGIVANRSDSSRQDDHQRHAARSSQGIHSTASTRTQTQPRDQSEIASRVIPDEPPSAISLRRWLTRSDDSRVNYNPPVKTKPIRKEPTTPIREQRISVPPPGTTPEITLNEVQSTPYTARTAKTPSTSRTGDVNLVTPPTGHYSSGISSSLIHRSPRQQGMDFDVSPSPKPGARRGLVGSDCGIAEVTSRVYPDINADPELYRHPSAPPLRASEVERNIERFRAKCDSVRGLGMPFQDVVRGWEERAAMGKREGPQAQLGAGGMGGIGSLPGGKSHLSRLREIFEQPAVVAKDVRRTPRLSSPTRSPRPTALEPRSSTPDRWVKLGPEGQVKRVWKLEYENDAHSSPVSRVAALRGSLAAPRRVSESSGVSRCSDQSLERLRRVSHSGFNSNRPVLRPTIANSTIPSTSGDTHSQAPRTGLRSVSNSLALFRALEQMSKLRDRQSQAIESLHKRSTGGKERERLKRQYAELSKEIEGWDVVIQNLRSSVEDV